jgi:hypothetical protein
MTKAQFMTSDAAWQDVEPGVRRRILRAEGGLMLMEVAFAADRRQSMIGFN